VLGIKTYKRNEQTVYIATSEHNSSKSIIGANEYFNRQNSQSGLF
jgi:hypothetical protein